MDEELRRYILLRDGGCCARFAGEKLGRMRWPMFAELSDPGLCKNAFGSWQSGTSLLWQTVDHVRDEAQMGSYKGAAPDDRWHLWTLCHWHHIESGWATKAEVRGVARLYIPAANAAADQFGYPRVPEGAKWG